MGQMVASLILVLSVAALAQFALSYWRALLQETATRELSRRALEAGLAKLKLEPGDFDVVVSMYRICPPLGQQPTRLAAVRAYYRTIRALADVTESRLARALGLIRLADWTQREMQACTRYVAVLLDQRVTENLASAAKTHSY
ncbi:MAG: hypothetical protein K6U02_00290 [Firmicutes bacterium]|nr:hypothetical protein [Bacillota bacterium]